jgi:outer membrane protein insertion porin family
MNKQVHSIFLILIAALAYPPPVSAQARPSANQSTKHTKASPADAIKLVALKVTGTQRYNDKEILAASGLELGQVVSEGDFKEAVRRLGETGLFTDVAYAFSFSDAGTKLELQLTDTDKKRLIPAVFENFVWFTDAELISELQKRVPLFKQVLPVAGTLPDRLNDSLQSILSEKQLPGHVDYMRQGKQEGGDLTGIAYRVTDVEIRVRNCEFPGAAREQSAALIQAAHKLAGVPYDRSSLAAVARLDFLPVFLRHGYLRAEFAPSEAKVVPKSSHEEELANVEVDAVFPVTPGKVYSTLDVSWKGNSALKTEELRGLIHLPVGEPADAVRLVNDVESVERLYHSRGYMAAKVTADPAIDDEKSAVRYAINVVEGDQYKMGELEIVGLDTQATTHLQSAWSLHEGDPYNGDYARKFLESTNRFLPGGVAWDIAVHESINTKDKTVDVTLRFRPK